VTTGRDVAAELTWEVDVVELEVFVLVVAVLVVVAWAAGDGSGPSRDGAFTGARSGPAPRATAGATISPTAPSTALTSTRANRGRCGSNFITRSLSALVDVVLADPAVVVKRP
jgi:hypothetical protein